MYLIKVNGYVIDKKELTPEDVKKFSSNPDILLIRVDNK